MTVAVATVVVFGTPAIFLYPLLYPQNQHWSLIPGGASGFGIYAGSTIHEVAQVVAASRSVGPRAADTALAPSPRCRRQDKCDRAMGRSLRSIRRCG